MISHDLHRFQSSHRWSMFQTSGSTLRSNRYRYRVRYRYRNITPFGNEIQNSRLDRISAMSARVGNRVYLHSERWASNWERIPIPIPIARRRRYGALSPSYHARPSHKFEKRCEARQNEIRAGSVLGHVTKRIAVITPHRALVVLRFLLNSPRKTACCWPKSAIHPHSIDSIRSAETGEICGLGAM